MSGVTIIDLRDYEHVMLPTLYQQQTHLTKYSRWLEEISRRETWPETVFRYCDFMFNHIQRNFGYRVTDFVQRRIYEGILFLKVMPSMRAMMTAGKALELDNAASYNCAYTHVDWLDAHVEAFYLSMCGCGVGYSVERQFTGQLPILPRKLEKIDHVIVVPDDRIGWANSYRELLTLLFEGKIPSWDVSLVRLAGAPLKTFGGRASGPQPLIDLFNYAISVIRDCVNDGRGRLDSIDNHLLMTKMADVAVSGGVRRAAMISLSNPSDRRMRDVKSGDWFPRAPHLSLANISCAWTDYPEADYFMEEWLALVKSKSGERGVINRFALTEQAKKYRRIRPEEYEYGLNPCGEIILRSKQFCNLTTNIIRADDTLTDLIEKIELSAIIGTMQSTLTDFRFLHPDWKFNCEEERLLGVSLNGIFDNKYMAGLDYIRQGSYLTENFVQDGVKMELPETLAILRDQAVITNKNWADRLGINAAAAITAIKPEGNNSNLVDCSSGIHPRYSKDHYIRTNRGNKVDRMAQFLKTSGVVCEDDARSPDTCWVFSFPIKVPEGAITRGDFTALEHAEIWKLYQEHYCEHKASITINVKDSEWFKIGAWVYDNFGIMSGCAFLPYEDHIYQQAPYQECTTTEYDQLVSLTPPAIDFTLFNEHADYTEGPKELACFGASCEVI